MAWLLDPNRALWLLVELSCTVVLVRAVRHWRRLWQDRDARDAVVVAVLVMAAGAVLYAWTPGISGYVVASCWSALLLLPALALRGAQRLAMGRRYRVAMLLTRFAGLLRPMGSWRATYTYYAGLRQWSRGDRDGGLKFWRELVRSQGLLQPVAAVEQLALEGEWDEVADRAARELAREPGLWPSLLPRYLRALGETDRTDAMLEVLERYTPQLMAQPALMGPCLLPVFAFTGRRQRLKELFLGPLASLDRTSREAWLGTAELVEGDTAAGHGRLSGALSGADSPQRLAIERRLTRPAPAAAHLLGPQSRRTLAELERAWDAARHVVLACLPRRVLVVTWSVSISLVLAFFAELHHGKSTRTDTLLALGALDPALVRAGQWWRLLTAQWLHFGPVHLGFNLLSLVLLGMYVERALGSLGTLAVYLAAGTLGMLAHTLLVTLGAGSEDLLVGASGGVMGLAGALGAILLQGWRGRGLVVARDQLRWIALLLVVQAVIDLWLPGISFLGHALGATVGFAVAGVIVRLAWRLWSMVTVPALTASFVGAIAANHLPWRKPPCSSGEVTECRVSCDLGVFESCATLGYKYSVGKDVAQDFDQARRWLRRACEGGVPDGCADLGILHARGDGGPRDHRRAVELYTLACQGGSAFGCRHLGLSLLRGQDGGQRLRENGGTRDPQQAKRLFERACSAGDQPSCELARTPPRR